MNTKFNIDDELYYLYNQGISSSKVVRILIEVGGETYGMYQKAIGGMDDFTWIEAGKVFRSKKDLIDSL